MPGKDPKIPASSMSPGTTCLRWLIAEETRPLEKGIWSYSMDPEPLIPMAQFSPNLWEQKEGRLVELQSPAHPQASFIAPHAGSGEKSLIFQLSVADSGGLRAQDECIVNISSESLPPIASAGSDQVICPGDTVVLDASGSMDEDGSIASFHWVQVLGVPVVLSDPSLAVCSFTAPKVEGMDKAGLILLFRVTVQNKAGLRDSADVRTFVER